MRQMYLTSYWDAVICISLCLSEGWMLPWPSAWNILLIQLTVYSEEGWLTLPNTHKHTHTLGRRERERPYAQFTSNSDNNAAWICCIVTPLWNVQRLQLHQPLNEICVIKPGYCDFLCTSLASFQLGLIVCCWCNRKWNSLRSFGS